MYDAIDDIYYKRRPLPEIENMPPPIDISVPDQTKGLPFVNELMVNLHEPPPKFVLWCPEIGERPILLKVLCQIDHADKPAELEVRPINLTDEFDPDPNFSTDDFHLPSKRITSYHSESSDLTGLFMIMWVDAVESLYKEVLAE